MTPPKTGSGVLDSLQAEACLRLWETKAFDTLDIAHVLQVDEFVVARTLQSARDVVHLLYREMHS